MSTLFQNALSAFSKKDSIQCSDIATQKNKNETHNLNLMEEAGFFIMHIDPLDKIKIYDCITGKGERFFNVLKNDDLLYALKNKYRENLSVLSIDAILEQTEWFIQYDNFFLAGNMLTENGKKTSYKEFYESMVGVF